MLSDIDNKITAYINHITKHPMENMYVAADKFFTGQIEVHTSQNLVIPELLNLTPTKRNLAINIVKTKTNYDISPSGDDFKDFLKFKEVGEVIREAIPRSVEKIKWLFK